ncbi:MAG: protoporphyrinogen oxidase [Acidimicrobiales bacterium]
MHVAVVGGGIAGLAAAHELADRDGVTTTVLEAAAHLGGKVRTEPFAGSELDTGPDSFLARRPEALRLCAELGLTDRLESPATGGAWLWVGGRLRPIPKATLLGLPTDIVAVARAGVLSPVGLARLAASPLLARARQPLAPGVDRSLGSVIRRGLGDEVHERLVDPLVGGINAGNTDELSIDAVAPQLAAAARRSPDLMAGARQLLAAGGHEPGGARDVPAAGPRSGPDQTGPVFYGLTGGMAGLVDALATRLDRAGTTVRTTSAVTGITRLGRGWAVATDGGAVVADAVVLATPAHVAAPLLAPLDAAIAGVLAAIDHASVTLVAFAWPLAAIPAPLSGSGFLVPRGEGRLTTACSWSSSKWRHLSSPERALMRVSVGRAGDGRGEAMDDDELVARLRVELGEAMGITAAPSEVRVTRWPDAFPQYAPGHLDRIDAVERALARRLPGLALAGAALRGVGIPACIGSGRTAAKAVVGEKSPT